MAGRPKGTPKTGGRQKGTPNKVTADLKGAILAAFDQAGGVEYLAKLAITNSSAFCTLLGKVLPTTIAGDAENPLVMQVKAAAQTLGAKLDRIPAPDRAATPPDGVVRH